MIALGQSLGLTTVAEGVETLERLHVLQIGCDHAQGFLFAPRIPTGEIGGATERIQADDATRPAECRRDACASRPRGARGAR